MEPFSKGSIAMLDSIIQATKNGATSVAGGGDTVALLKKVKGSAEKLSIVEPKLTFRCGGGAMHRCIHEPNFRSEKAGAVQRAPWPLNESFRRRGHHGTCRPHHHGISLRVQTAQFVCLSS